MWLGAETAVPTEWWAQLGIGALIAAPAWWLYLTTLKERSALNQKLDEVRKEQVTRERELNEHIIPNLVHAVELLSRTPYALERTLTTAASHSTTDGDIQPVLGQLSDLVQRLEQRTR